MTLRRRSVSLSDESSLLLWRNSPAEQLHQLNGGPIDIHDHEHWFRNRILTASTNPFWAYERENTTIGFFRAEMSDSLQLEFQISILVSPDYRSQGVGTLILKDAIRSMRQFSPSCTLLAIIHQGNVSSLKLFQKAGFQPHSMRRDPFMQFRLRL